MEPWKGALNQNEETPISCFCFCFIQIVIVLWSFYEIFQDEIVVQGPASPSVIECWRREWPARLVWGLHACFWPLLADMRVFARPQISIGCSKSTLETSKCSSGEGYFTCPMANVLSKVKFVLFQCLFRFCSTLVVNHLHLFYFFRIRICCHRHFKIMN